MKRRYQRGSERCSLNLLPPSIDDYVSQDNPVRVIDAFINSLDLSEIGFRHSSGELRAGQPAYDPADLLKLYVYGYINRIRSSRRLENETKRNLELIWLIKELKPSYKTISDFRKNNPEALKKVNRDFVLFCKDLELFGGEFVAIDGAFFNGNAGKHSVLTENKLKKNLERIENAISDYLLKLDEADKQEETPFGKAFNVKEKLEQLNKKLLRYENQRKKLLQSNDKQLSQTDPDARLLVKSGQKVTGYNIQIAVDEKHKLIVSGEVTNDGNDSLQFYPMAKKSKNILGAKELAVAADAGYYQQEQIKNCIDEGIIPYIKKPNKSFVAKKQGRFIREDFVFEAENNRYKCPGKQYLNRVGAEINRGKTAIRYKSSTSTCRKCSLKGKCLPAKTLYRQIHRWEHEKIIEDHDKRMAEFGDKAMKRRGSLVEHPFGTLKLWCGWTHFLVRGKKKVSGEWNLLMFCYNFKRVLNILGLEKFKEILAKRMEIFKKIDLTFIYHQK